MWTCYRNELAGNDSFAIMRLQLKKFKCATHARGSGGGGGGECAQNGARLILRRCSSIFFEIEVTQLKAELSMIAWTAEPKSKCAHELQAESPHRKGWHKRHGPNIWILIISLVNFLGNKITSKGSIINDFQNDAPRLPEALASTVMML